MVFTPVLLSGGVITESSVQGDDQYEKVECSLAGTVRLQGWKWHFCIGSSIISPCITLVLCKELHDLAPLKSICMALPVYLQFSPFRFIFMALLIPGVGRERPPSKRPGHALLAFLFPRHLFFPILLKRLKRHTVFFQFLANSLPKN